MKLLNKKPPRRLRQREGVLKLPAPTVTSPLIPSKRFVHFEGWPNNQTEGWYERR